MSKHRYHQRGKVRDKEEKEEKEEVKLPKKGGLDKARQHLKSLKKKVQPIIMIAFSEEKDGEPNPKKSSSARRIAIQRKAKS